MLYGFHLLHAHPMREHLDMQGSPLVFPSKLLLVIVVSDAKLQLCTRTKSAGVCVCYS